MPAHSHACPCQRACLPGHPPRHATAGKVCPVPVSLSSCPVLSNPKYSFHPTKSKPHKMHVTYFHVSMSKQTEILLGGWVAGCWKEGRKSRGRYRTNRCGNGEYKHENCSGTEEGRWQAPHGRQVGTGTEGCSSEKIRSKAGTEGR